MTTEQKLIELEKRISVLEEVIHRMLPKTHSKPYKAPKRRYYE
jgi:ribosomal protein L13|tara:strand:+ start:264 stop:392 length:129 start_codon:yes stop_codon:yes gene_type:complete